MVGIDGVEAGRLVNGMIGKGIRVRSDIEEVLLERIVDKHVEDQV